MSAPLDVVLFSCAFLGFRHGFDYDHIAAITDIAGVQSRASTTMRMGLMYALGHAATVALLGGIVIGFQLTLPSGMDRWAERFVGATLIVLAVYVFSTLVRTGGRSLPKSRAALMIGAVRWIHGRLHRWTTGNRTSANRTTGDLRERPRQATDVSAPACFGIGVIHGFGAETPSQLALFLLAANLGGMRRGLLGLSVFLAGLLAMNTLMTASAAGLFKVGRRWSGWYPVLTGLTASYSFVIGVIFLFGHSTLLKNISG